MIKSYSDKELDLIRTAGKIVRGCLNMLKLECKPGVSTLHLDVLANQYIESMGATATFYNYHGFAGHICTSVNNQVVHGIPSADVILKEGDIISIDVGATYKGYIGDAARTFAVGAINEKAQQLIDTTMKSFYAAIDTLKSGDPVCKIGECIEKYIKANSSYSIVRDLTGHGVGDNLHEDPVIYNFKNNVTETLPENCVLAIEPMINIGTHKVNILKDGWTIVTADGKLSAHYENSIIVTKNGVEVITA